MSEPSMHKPAPRRKRRAPALPPPAAGVAALRGERNTPDQTRELVLAIALNEFAEKGLAGARVDVIAAKAGVNKQALYYHFGSKDDLFRATLERGYEKVRDANVELARTAPRSPPAEAMEYTIGRLFDRIRNNQKLLGLIGDENKYRGVHLQDRALVNSAVLPLFEYLGDLLEAGRRDGVFRPGIEPEQLFLTIVSMCMLYFTNTYTLSALVGRDLNADAAIAERKRHVVEMILAGLRA